MPRIPSYSDEGIQLNAPIAEGSGFRRSPDLTVDFEAQRNQKLFAGITEVAGALAVREQAMRNNMEYNDKLNKFMLEAQDKRTELLNRKGTNALHYDPTEDNPDGQMSVTEDYDAWYKEAYNRYVANTKNSVVREKLKTRVGEINVAYTGDITGHELKMQDEATINSNAATASTAKNEMIAAVINGNKTAYDFYNKQRQEANYFTYAVKGSSQEEIDASEMADMDSVIGEAFDETVAVDPNKAMQIVNQHRSEVSSLKFLQMSQKTAGFLRRQATNNFVEQEFKKHANEWRGADGRVNFNTAFEALKSNKKSIAIAGAPSRDATIQAVLDGESSGDYDAFNGQAYGAYQFLQPTYESEFYNAGLQEKFGKPHWGNASKEEQDAVMKAHWERLYNLVDGEIDAMFAGHYGGDGAAIAWHKETQNGGDHSGDRWTRKQGDKGDQPSFIEYIADKHKRLGSMGTQGYSTQISDEEIESSLKDLISRDNATITSNEVAAQEAMAQEMNALLQSGEIVDRGTITREASAIGSRFGVRPTIVNGLIRSGLSTAGINDEQAHKDAMKVLNEIIYDWNANGTPLPDIHSPLVQQIGDKSVINQYKRLHDSFMKLETSGLKTQVDELLSTNDMNRLINETAKLKSGGDGQQQAYEILKLKAGIAEMANTLGRCPTPDEAWTYLNGQYVHTNIEKPGFALPWEDNTYTKVGMHGDSDIHYEEK